MRTERKRKRARDVDGSIRVGERGGLFGREAVLAGA